MGIAVAVLITLFALPSYDTSEIVSHLSPSLVYGAVAFIAGFAAAFTMTKTQLNETLPGIAIAIAIIPPIAAAGIGIATFQWEIVRASLMLFLLNFIAIFAGSLIVFLLMDTYAKKNLAKQTLKQEQEKIGKNNVK